MKQQIVTNTLGTVAAVALISVVGFLWTLTLDGVNRWQVSLIKQASNTTMAKVLEEPKLKAWREDVPIAHLKRHHAGCDHDEKMVTGACFAAMHRYCNTRGLGAVGIGQEHSDGVIRVACIR